MAGTCDDTGVDAQLFSEPTTVAGRSELPTAIDAAPCISKEEASSSSSTSYISARIQSMTELRNDGSSLEFQIEASKIHWSEVDPSCVVNKAKETNQEIFKNLKKQWGEFFWDYGERLVVGQKIAEGGQAEIYEAEVTLLDSIESRGSRFQYVLKVMKGVYSLRDLQSQWPLGMLRQIEEGHPFSSDTDSYCLIWGATLLKDDRFAFLLPRYWGDLRKLINLRIQHNNYKCPPFTTLTAKLIMLQIAVAMEELHSHDILHRDLKASNVLVKWRACGLGDEDCEDVDFDPLHEDRFHCAVTDFECSVGVVGTAFWRAPEVLLAVQNRHVTLEQFTQKADVYSYAMTCFEILTGNIPFEGHPRTNFDHILRGERPRLPDSIDPQIRTLLSRCWHKAPLERPTFAEIVRILDEVSPSTVVNELTEMWQSAAEVGCFICQKYLGQSEILNAFDEM